MIKLKLRLIFKNFTLKPKIKTKKMYGIIAITSVKEVFDRFLIFFQNSSANNEDI